MLRMVWQRRIIFTVLGLFRIVSAVTQVTLLHWNDQHARVDPADNNGATCTGLVQNQDASLCFGGYARLASFFNQVKT
jgi:2',3'-cyclic-nucleotide 2'-phosphodiesterase (5'-nucleotidase family)